MQMHHMMPIDNDSIQVEGEECVKRKHNTIEIIEKHDIFI